MSDDWMLVVVTEVPEDSKDWQTEIVVEKDGAKPTEQSSVNTETAEDLKDWQYDKWTSQLAGSSSDQNSATGSAQNTTGVISKRKKDTSAGLGKRRSSRIASKLQPPCKVGLATVEEEQSVEPKKAARQQVAALANSCGEAFVEISEPICNNVHRQCTPALLLDDDHGNHDTGETESTGDPLSLVDVDSRRQYEQVCGWSFFGDNPCSYTCSSPELMLIHVHNTHRFKYCPFCDKDVDEDLKSHLSSQHLSSGNTSTNDNTGNPPEGNVDQDDSASLVAEILYRCPFCGVDFPGPIEQQSHVKRDCGEAKKFYSEQYAICPFCAVSDQTDLFTHIIGCKDLLQHVENKQKYCSYCDKDVDKNVKNHPSSQHLSSGNPSTNDNTKNSPDGNVDQDDSASLVAEIVCDLCKDGRRKTVFKRQRDLDRHQLTIHRNHPGRPDLAYSRNEWNFRRTCDLCNGIFVSKERMLRHRLLAIDGVCAPHKNRSKYAANTKEFSDEDSFKNWLKTHPRKEPKTERDIEVQKLKQIEELKRLLLLSLESGKNNAQAQGKQNKDKENRSKKKTKKKNIVEREPTTESDSTEDSVEEEVR